MLKDIYREIDIKVSQSGIHEEQQMVESCMGDTIYNFGEVREKSQNNIKLLRLWVSYNILTDCVGSIEK